MDWTDITGPVARDATINTLPRKRDGVTILPMVPPAKVRARLGHLGRTEFLRTPRRTMFHESGIPAKRLA